MTEFLSLLPALAVPGSAICALVIGIVALLRLRSTDREALSSSQREWIGKIEAARDVAEARADKFLGQLDVERQKRIESEQAKLIAQGEAAALQRRVEALEVRLQQCEPPGRQRGT